MKNPSDLYLLTAQECLDCLRREKRLVVRLIVCDSFLSLMANWSEGKINVSRVLTHFPDGIVAVIDEKIL